MTRRRRLLAAAVALGVGLVLAPAAFQMFSRAPSGGEMIDDFRPHMTQQRIDSFRSHLDRIGAAEAEAQASGAGELPALAALHTEWSGIDADMTGMLDDIEPNIGNFEAVDALPPFPLFPWFFVLPGLIAAGLAAWGLLRVRAGRAAGPALTALAVLGVGLVAAPAVFQMFGRAPKGAEMIDDLRPLMTEARVTTLQQSFLVIGAAEGELRIEVLPATAAGELPATRAFVERWPAMSAEMAPMIGAMADNLDNFADVDALPPFGLFPWFFVIPGVLLVGIGVAGRGRAHAPAVAAALSHEGG